jgi:hypothetical protein
VARLSTFTGDGRVAGGADSSIARRTASSRLMRDRSLGPYFSIHAGRVAGLGRRDGSFSGGP